MHLHVEFSSLTISPSQCDETKPACRKCVAGELRCPYLDDTASLRVAGSSSSTPSSSMLTPVSLAQTPASSSSLSESTLASYPTLSPNLPSHGVLDMVHLELLNHILSDGDMNILYFQSSPSESSLLMKEAMHYAFSNPYLMHELLSLSATHLSIIQPSNSAVWKHQSTTLQTHALSLFNNTTLQPPTPTSFIPKFLFASILGVHLLHDAISSPSSQSGPYLDRFVNFLRLAKGSRMQLTGSSWSSFGETSFHSIFKSSNNIPLASTAHAHQLLPLETRLQSADLSVSSSKIYQDALSRLKSAYQAHNEIVDDETRSTAISAIFAWPVLVENEFTDLLEQRRPEALVVLAHFAVLLHWHREIWVFGAGGRSVVECVSGYLGSAWGSWLEWAGKEVEL